MLLFHNIKGKQHQTDENQDSCLQGKQQEECLLWHIFVRNAFLPIFLPKEENVALPYALFVKR